MSARVLTASEVAARLRYTPDTFYGKRKALQAEHNFPAPLPGPGRPRWSAAAVDDWIEGRRITITLPEDDAWAATLDRRAAELAGATHPAQIAG